MGIANIERCMVCKTLQGQLKWNSNVKKICAPGKSVEWNSSEGGWGIVWKSLRSSFVVGAVAGASTEMDFSWRIFDLKTFPREYPWENPEEQIWRPQLRWWSRWTHHQGGCLMQMILTTRRAFGGIFHMNSNFILPRTTSTVKWLYVCNTVS